jgi:hypothetical protein
VTQEYNREELLYQSTHKNLNQQRQLMRLAGTPCSCPCLNSKENWCWATTTDAKQNLSKRESTDPSGAHEIGGRSQPRRTEAEAEKKPVTRCRSWRHKPSRWTRSRTQRRHTPLRSIEGRRTGAGQKSERREKPAAASRTDADSKALKQDFR